MGHTTVDKAANDLSGNWSESTKDSTELEVLLLRVHSSETIDKACDASHGEWDSDFSELKVRLHAAEGDTSSTEWSVESTLEAPEILILHTSVNEAANHLSGNWSESTKDSTELEILL